MISFQIFESDKKIFHLNIENILLLLLLFFSFLNTFKPLLAFSKYGLILIILSGLVVLLVNIFRMKPLNGKLYGVVIFNINAIQINEKVFSINDIEKIFLRINDYEGKVLGSMRLSFYPRLSNGTNNVLRLEFKNGEKLMLFFKSDLEYEYEKLRPFISEAIRYNLMSLEEGRKILKLNDYEILKFKNELHKKELNS